PLSLTLSARPGKFEDCLLSSLDEITKMTSPSYFKSAELRNTITAHELELALERENALAMAHSFTAWWASLGLDRFNGYLQALRNVKPQDLSAVVARYMVGKPFAAGVLLSPENSQKHHVDAARLRGLMNWKIPLRDRSSR